MKTTLNGTTEFKICLFRCTTKKYPLQPENRCLDFKGLFSQNPVMQGFYIKSLYVAKNTKHRFGRVSKEKEWSSPLREFHYVRTNTLTKRDSFSIIMGDLNQQTDPNLNVYTKKSQSRGWLNEPELVQEIIGEYRRQRSYRLPLTIREIPMKCLYHILMLIHLQCFHETFSILGMCLHSIIITFQNLWVY